MSKQLVKDNKQFIDFILQKDGSRADRWKRYNDKDGDWYKRAEGLTENISS
jgi:hypothetical protein